MVFESQEIEVNPITAYIQIPKWLDVLLETITLDKIVISVEMETALLYVFPNPFVSILYIE